MPVLGGDNMNRLYQTGIALLVLTAGIGCGGDGSEGRVARRYEAFKDGNLASIRDTTIMDETTHKLRVDHMLTVAVGKDTFHIHMSSYPAGIKTGDNVRFATEYCHYGTKTPFFTNYTATLPNDGIEKR